MSAVISAAVVDPFQRKTTTLDGPLLTLFGRERVTRARVINDKMYRGRVTRTPFALLCLDDIVTIAYVIRSAGRSPDRATPLFVRNRLSLRGPPSSSLSKRNRSCPSVRAATSSRRISNITDDGNYRPSDI